MFQKSDWSSPLSAASDLTPHRPVKVQRPRSGLTQQTAPSASYQVTLPEGSLFDVYSGSNTEQHLNL